jgi:preprotein translocase subunit SecD
VIPLSGATRTVKPLRLSLWVCAFAGTTFAAALAQSIPIEVVQAEATYDQVTGKPLVSFRMSPGSARAFAELTLKNVGHALAIVIDGRVISKPIIRTPILGGTGQIDGNFSAEEARAMASRLAGGAAKMTMEIVPDGSPGK